jgi:hypothetical protein
MEVLQLEANELDAFRSDFLALEPRIGEEFAPGEHCLGCRREHECPARDAFIRSAGAALVEAGPGAVAPARLAEMYPRVQQLERAIEAYRSALRLALADGPLPVGDGKQLELVEAHRTLVDPRAAWPVLEAHGFTEADLARVTSMSKSEIEAIARERAPARGKARQAAAIVQALDEAGALTQATYTKLQQTKITEGDDGHGE